MDDFEEDNKDSEVLNKGEKTKTTWNAGEYFFKTLGKCKEAFFQYNQEGNIEGMFWLIRMELGFVKSYLVKKPELIGQLKDNLLKAENLLFNNNNNKQIQTMSKGLALKYIHNAWEDLNTLEAINGLLQPVNKTPDQKIRQYGN